MDLSKIGRIKDDEWYTPKALMLEVFEEIDKHFFNNGNLIKHKILMPFTLSTNSEYLPALKQLGYDITCLDEAKKVPLLFNDGSLNFFNIDFSKYKSHIIIDNPPFSIFSCIEQTLFNKCLYFIFGCISLSFHSKAALIIGDRFFLNNRRVPLAIHSNLDNGISNDDKIKEIFFIDDFKNKTPNVKSIWYKRIYEDKIIAGMDLNKKHNIKRLIMKYLKNYEGKKYFLGTAKILYFELFS